MPLGGPGIVRDFVTSRKHEWGTACYVPEVGDGQVSDLPRDADPAALAGKLASA